MPAWIVKLLTKVATTVVWRVLTELWDYVLETIGKKKRAKDAQKAEDEFLESGNKTPDLPIPEKLKEKEDAWKKYLARFRRKP